VWLTQAAQAGHPAAAFRLSTLYRTGAPGVPADEALAAHVAAQIKDSP
jgi:TPR repeat protein